MLTAVLLTEALQPVLRRSYALAQTPGPEQITVNVVSPGNVIYRQSP